MSRPPLFTGVYPFLATPFSDDAEQRVDAARLHAHIDELIVAVHSWHHVRRQGTGTLKSRHRPGAAAWPERRSGARALRLRLRRIESRGPDPVR